LSPQGRLVLYGLLSGNPCSVAAYDLIFRNVKVQGFWLANWFRNPDNRQKVRTVYPALMELAAQNVLRMSVEKVYELSEIHEAIAHSAQAEKRGKVLLKGRHFQASMNSNQ